MTDTIFDTPATSSATTETAVNAPVVKPEDLLLKAIVNEQGAQKYQSVEDAIKALAASQDHIKRIEQENAQLREATTKNKTMEELLEALKPKVEQAPAAPSQPSQEVNLNDVVNRILSERERDQIKHQNISFLTGKLKEVYGEDKASEVFYSKAEAQGFSRESINKLAADNPKAVLKLLDITDKTPTPNVYGVRTEALPYGKELPSSTGGMALGDNKALVSSWRNAGEAVKIANNIK